MQYKNSQNRSKLEKIIFLLIHPFSRNGKSHTFVHCAWSILKFLWVRFNFQRRSFANRFILTLRLWPRRGRRLNITAIRFPAAVSQASETQRVLHKSPVGFLCESREPSSRSLRKDVFHLLLVTLFAISNENFCLSSSSEKPENQKIWIQFPSFLVDF